MSFKQAFRLICLWQVVFGDRNDDFLNNGWEFVGFIDRACGSQLDCTGNVPVCGAETNGVTAQDRNDHDGCVAQECETGAQYTFNTYTCAFRKDEFLSKGWTYIGLINRWCSSNLDCTGDVPTCDASTEGKTVQDRQSHDGCVAQECEGGTQYYHTTYYCEVPTAAPTAEPVEGCARLDIDGYLNGCSSVITTVSGAISTNADAITANSDAITANGNAATANADAIIINADGITTNGNAATANADDIATNSVAITSNTNAITTNKGEFDVFKVEVNTALDEIGNFNAAHAPIGAKIDDSGIEYASISFKDSVVFGLLSLNFALVIYVFCVLKAQNKRLKGGYSVTYNQDAYDDAQPLKI